VHTPRLLFLDEPTTGVDPVSRREFWRILSELHAGGTTLFIATPYMDEAERCDRVGFIDGGRLSLAASPAQIIADVSRESLEVRGTPLREACRILGELPGIATVDMFGDRLRAVLSDTELTALDVERVLREHGIDVDSVRPSAATMESAFVELLRRGAR
jgi:ABC-2 type transport system ATP-binding protein